MLAFTFIVLFLRLSTAQGEIRSFWQVTDFHHDPNYTKIGGDPNDRKMCHRDASDPNRTLGTFGSYHCDAPWTLVEHAIAGMAKIEQNPDFILWTGDDGPHVPTSELSTPKVLRIISDITSALLRYFPNTTFFPVLGNHDYYPKGAMPPEPNTIYEHVGSYWSHSSSRWLGDEETALFKKYGYYSSVYTPPGDAKTQPIRMLGLNTVYYYTQDKLTGNLPDPAAQFSWMENECKTARANGEKIYVIGHVPPGMFERSRDTSWFYSQFNKKFLEFLKNNVDVISGNFFAHEHTDTFKVFRGKNSSAGVLFLAPAVTPWNTSLPGVGPNNPGIRLYDYDTATGRVVNIRQYWLNLTEANSRNETDWTLEYRATTRYGVPDVGGASMIELAERFLKEGDSTFDAYYGFNSVSYDFSCDAECKTTQVCSIMCVDYDEYYRCLNDPVHVTSICLKNKDDDGGVFIPLYGKILIGVGGGAVVIAIVLTIAACRKKKSKERSPKPGSTEPLLNP